MADSATKPFTIQIPSPTGRNIETIRRKKNLKTPSAAIRFAIEVINPDRLKIPEKDKGIQISFRIGKAGRTKISRIARANKISNGEAVRFVVDAVAARIK